MLRSVLSLSGAALVGAALAAALSSGEQEREPSPAVLALGDSVFHGKVGGALCYVCHGPTGKGVPGIGPNLLDNEWLNGDGTRTAIAKVVREGVATPKKMPAPMPPRGGGQLTDAQVDAVSAYVYSLRQPKK